MRAASALLSLFVCGCSMVFVKGPPDPHEPSVEPDCTRSKVLPALDSIGGAVLGIAAIGAFAGVGGFSFKSNADENAEDHRPWALGLSAASLALLSSGIVGLSRTSRCDEAHDLHRAQKSY